MLWGALENPDAAAFSLSRGTIELMIEKTYIVRFRPPETTVQVLIAASAEVADDYLVMFKANGAMAAMFAMEVVESWSDSETDLLL